MVEVRARQKGTGLILGLDVHHDEHPTEDGMHELTCKVSEIGVIGGDGSALAIDAITSKHWTVFLDFGMKEGSADSVRYAGALCDVLRQTFSGDWEIWYGGDIDPITVRFKNRGLMQFAFINLRCVRESGESTEGATYRIVCRGSGFSGDSVPEIKQACELEIANLQQAVESVPLKVVDTKSPPLRQQVISLIESKMPSDWALVK